MGLLLALSLAQETVHIARNDDRKPQIELLLRRYAAIRLDDPTAAVAALDALLSEVREGPVECRLRIERMANVFSDPVDFLPYQLRGRARLALAAADPARRRALLRDAVADLDASLARKAVSSRPFLEAALTAAWEDFRPDLAFERWDPARELGGLLRRVRPPTAWAAEEMRKAVEQLDALGGAPEDKHAPARRALAWSDAIAAFAGPGEGREALHARASALLARRTRVTLQIAVNPFAEISRVTREGKDVELPVRHTPAVLVLEAGDLALDLLHPAWGKRSFRIAPGDLRDGRLYVLSGDMESGVLALRELAR